MGEIERGGADATSLPSVVATSSLALGKADTGYRGEGGERAAQAGR